MFLSAYRIIAALADRLTAGDAQAVLGLLGESVSVPEGEYRRTDESHILIAAAIARRHPDLRAEAMRHLVGLCEREPHLFDLSATAVIQTNLELVGPQLRDLVQHDHRQAAALLAAADRDTASREGAEAAAERLRQPTSNTSGHYAIGTGAIADSLLARALPARIAQNTSECFCLKEIRHMRGRRTAPATYLRRNDVRSDLFSTSCRSNRDDGARRQTNSTHRRQPAA